MHLETVMRKMTVKNKKLIKKLEEELAKAPTGTLLCKKDRGYYKWYRINETRESTYIPKKEEHMAAELAAKMVRQRYLEDLRKEQFAIDQYLKHHNAGTSRVDVFLKRTNDEMRRLVALGFRTLDQQQKAWQNAAFTTNTIYPEKRKIRTLRGDLVRSKSEAMIADYLYTHGIPYRYECELRIGTRTIYPDFLILHPITGELLVIEHFGLMDSEEYLQQYVQKMSLYTMHGYLPDHNLICFYENQEHPLDSSMIADKLDYVLGAV